MNRDKILDIATKLPREAYIDLLCAGARWLFEAPGGYTGPMMIFKNLSYNQLKAICKAYCDEEDDEEDDGECADTFLRRVYTDLRDTWESTHKDVSDNNIIPYEIQEINPDKER